MSHEHNSCSEQSFQLLEYQKFPRIGNTISTPLGVRLFLRTGLSHGETPDFEALTAAKNYTSKVNVESELEFG